MVNTMRQPYISVPANVPKSEVYANIKANNTEAVIFKLMPSAVSGCVDIGGS